MNTDTKLTFLYPGSMPIGYIGEADSLQEVRPLPDFAVYPENIFARDELIEGEETELKFHAYNLGSRGGWFTITVSDGKKEIWKEEHHYLDAFSSETFSFPWVPGNGNRQITVALDNTSIGLKELDASNNIAVAHMETRKREVPVIGDASYGEIYEATPFSIVLDVDNCADLSSMEFSIDGKKIDYHVRESQSGYRKRYQINVEQGLEIGEHHAKVSIKYNVALGKKTVAKEIPISVAEQRIAIPHAHDYPEGTLLYTELFDFQVTDTENLTQVQLVLDGRQIIGVKQEEEENGKRYYVNAGVFGVGSHMITIRMYYTGKKGEILFEDCNVPVMVLPEEESYFTFALEAGIENPEFYLYNTSEEECLELQCKEMGNGFYRFTKTLDIVKYPEKYKLLVKHNAGIFVQEISVNNALLTLKNCHSVHLEKGNGFAYAKIEQCQLLQIGKQNISFNLPMVDDICISPGAYVLQISGSIGQEYFKRVVEVDISQGNQTILLDDFVVSHSFKIEGSDSTDWFAEMYYKESDNSIWESQPMSTAYNSSTGILDCYTVNVLDYGTQRETIIIVHSGTECYVVPMSDLKDA